MTKTNPRTRAIALALAALMLVGLLPMTASASTIADGSKTCTVAPVERYYYLTTTAGTRLGASAYQYVTNDGLTGPAYCIDHGLAYSSHALEIRGAYTATPATAAAFATGYPQHALETFLERYPEETVLEGLTETEYGYATQLAVWATLGQLSIEGTDFTSGREAIREPSGDPQQMRIFRAIQLILKTANSWKTVYQTGMYIRREDNALGGNLSIPADMTLEFAADQEQYGIRRELINGTAYYTLEYIFASATSTYYSDYNIELWLEGAPAGTIFVDTENNELPRGSFHDNATWSLPSKTHKTTVNDNGYEYAGTGKLCIPVETAPNKGEITIRCGAYVMQYQVYLAHNEYSYEQSYIIADPSKGTQTANAVLNWGSLVTEKASLQITKVGGGGQTLSGATFTLNGSDGSSRTGTTDSDGGIFWTDLTPGVEYTLVETEPPAGYAVVDPINVSVQAARTTYVTVQDATQKQLIVRKLDAQTGYSLRGAVIAFKQINGGFYTTAVTDHAGLIQFDADSLPVGSYEVYELSAPEGYEPDSTVQTVHWDGKTDVTLTFRDVRKHTLVIYKCDSDNLRSLPGATFEVYKNGQLVTTVTTNDNGLAYVPDVTTGYYTVKETVAPAGYVADPEEHSVYVDAYDPATTDDPRIVVTNREKPQLRILKYDAQTMKPLSDTTFAIYRDGALLGQYTTDAAGEIVLNELEPGTYLVKEIAVKPGYVVNSTPQQIEIVAGTESYSLVFLNLVKPGIRMIKLDSQTLKPLAGARFRVTALGGSFSREYTSDENGEVVLDEMEPGAYEVEELSAPSGYLIDTGKRSVQINAGENAVFVFTNTPKPILRLEKRDAQTGEALPGARFSIRRLGTEGDPLECVTDQNGQIVLEGLEPGMYSVQEIAAPAGYVLNETEYHIQLHAGQTSTLTVNNHKRPDLRIVKYDAQTMAPLSGFQFAVYRDTMLIGEYTTDANGEIGLTNLEPGVYLVKEIAAPDDYTVDGTPQEIELEAGASVAYRLIFLNYRKPGIRIVKLDGETLLPLAGARFRVSQVGGSFSKEYLTDSSGEIVLTSLEPGAYEVTELSAPIGYVIDEAKRTVQINAGENAQFVFTNTAKPTLLLEKRDAETAEPLAGATFRIARIGEEGNSFDRTTDENGQIRIDGLEPGMYSVKEISAPTGYVLNEREYRVRLVAGELSTLTVSDHQKPDLRIVKYDAQTMQPLSGFRFAVYRDTKLVGEYTTDANGEIILSDLEPGVYLVKETAAPNEYELDTTPQEIELEAGRLEAYSLVFLNYRKPGIRIVKLDSDTLLPLAGARFRVSQIGGTFTKEYTTDESGEIELTALEPGAYEITELSAPAGYLADNASRTVRIVAGGNAFFVFTNTAKPSLVIEKKDADTGETLAGATFRIARIGDEGHSLDRTTDENGQIRIDELTPGMYSITEIAAPSGYVLNAQEYHVLVRAGEAAVLEVANRQKPDLRIVKYDAQTAQPLSGFQFAVYRDTKLVGEYTTDAKGEIVLNDLEPGVYLVKEIAVPDEYELDGTPQEIELEAGNIEPYRLVFLNYVKPGIRILKLDSQTMLPLAGARFRVSRIGGSFNREYTTDGSGEIELTALEPGAYEVMELSAPDGYLIDCAKRTVQINAGENAQFVFTNTSKPSLVIEKKDADTGETLAGATFRIARIGDEGHYLDRTTDENGQIKIDGLAPGIYSVRELMAPSGYVLNAQEYHVRLFAGKESTLIVPNCQRPDLRIVKYDAQTMEPLANVLFAIYRDTKLIGEYRTDANGEILLSELDPGVYLVKELAVPDTHVVNSTPQEIELKAGATETYNLVFLNYVKPGIRLIKLDSQTMQPLSNAKFRITQIGGSYCKELTTDGYGEINLSKLDPGSYTVEELMAPNGYLIDEAVRTIRIEGGENALFVFTDSKKPDLKIVKQDADTGLPLSGATFRVKRADGSTLTTKQTDENGEIVLEALEPGVYEITETVPPVGYLPAEQPTQLITLEPNKLGTVIFENHIQPGITIRKLDSVTGDPIRGARFRVSYGSSHSFTGELRDLGEHLTDENGEIRLTDLEDGWYRVTELEPAAGYALKDPTSQDFFLRGGESRTVTFENAPLSALVVYKFDSVTGEAVIGAVFQVKYLSGTSGTGGTVIGTYKTSVNGSFTVTGLKAGTYIVEELASDSGHVIDTAPQTAYLSGTEQDVVELYFGNKPKGSLVVKKVDAVTGAPLSDVEFLVTMTDGTVVGDANGKFVTDRSGSFTVSGLNPGVSLVVKETRAKSGYVLDDTAQTAVVIPGRAVSLEFRNYPKGSLIIRKYDSVTGRALPGAEFKVTTSSGELVAIEEGRISSNGVYVTDENGEIVLTKLNPDTYIVTETKAPHNYSLDSAAQTVRVNAADTQTLRFFDQPLCTLTVTKLDGNTKAPLNGAEFIVAYSDGTRIGRFVTDRYGQFLVSGLTRDATVVVTEDKAPTGYVKDPTPQQIVVRSGAVNSLTFENQPTSTLIIRKYITGTDYEPLSGVAFKVVDGTGAVVGPDDGVYYTNSTGEIVLTGLEPGAVVKAQEIRTVDGFVLDGTPQEIQIQAGAVQHLTFWNPRQGSVVIRKLDAITKKPLEGVTFTVRYSDGRVVDNNGGRISSNGIYTTNCNGEIAIYDVTGTLVITETKTIPGYAIDVGCKTQTVEVHPDDTQYLTFYNMPQGGLVVTKSDADSGKRISGVKFEIRKQNGEIVGTCTTDRNGVIQLPALERGWYTVTELKAADGYRLDATPQQVEVKDGETAYLELTNERVSGICIHKIDSVTGEGIYGVRFLICDHNNRPVEHLVTDQDGYASTETELSAGKYYVREIAAAEGYLQDQEEKTVYVRSGKTVTIDWENTPITGQIQITKTSAEYNSMNGWPAGTPIPNTVFEIYNRAGRLVDTVKTDKNGVAATRALPLGRYKIVEAQAASFYALDKTPIDVEIEFAGQIVRTAMTDKSLYTNVSITKRGYSEVMPGQSIRYEFSDIANNSTTALESFYWRDTLPTGAVRLDRIVTGTWNAMGNYKIVYKTNYSGEYKLLADSLSTGKNYVLDASPAALGLANGEYVTEFMAVFGIVPSGFRQVEAPKVYCTVLSTLAGGTQFTNVADVGGVYNSQWIMAVSRWVTTVYKPAEPAKPLPRTGY